MRRRPCKQTPLDGWLTINFSIRGQISSVRLLGVHHREILENKITTLPPYPLRFATGDKTKNVNDKIGAYCMIRYSDLTKLTPEHC